MGRSSIDTEILIPEAAIMGKCNCQNKAEESKNIDAVKVSAEITIKDLIGSWKARWNIGRMNYKVNPGLYKTGEPDSDSEVFISSNYKMSFDILRKNLKGINAWIIVLDTAGINVWCAAGKGTFGTDELARMIDKTSIKDHIAHKRIIVPHLGAPGISAHEIKKQSGLNVIYGPVKASDIKEFLKNNLKTTDKMKKVTFTLFERLILTPTEFVLSLKYSPLFLILLFLIDIIIGKNGLEVFYKDILIFFGALFSGTILFPVLLPFLPFRSFALKGWILGLIYITSINLTVFNSVHGNYVHMLTAPILVSFLAYNFTGSSTYTSLSGVEKELKISLPLYGLSILSGVVVLLINFF